MRHVYRLLWLAAWAEWAYLGVGLFHGLPRRPGPAVCKLRLGEGESIVGFLGDQHKIVVEDAVSAGEWRYVAFDVNTRQREHLPEDFRRRYGSPWLKGRVGLHPRPPRKRNFGGRYEDWGKPFGLSSPREWATIAIIDNETGLAVAREWAREQRYWESRDETLAVFEDGTIVRMPLRPDWSLFVCVQAALALPLVGLWAYLRRCRLRGATP